MVRTHTRKVAEIAPGVPPKGAKTCFVFFCHQCNTAFRPLIVHRFRPFLKKDMNQCPHAYTGEKFPNFCAGVFQVPKTDKNGGACARGTAQTAKFWQWE